jgi:hypothetical protein
MKLFISIFATLLFACGDNNVVGQPEEVPDFTNTSGPHGLPGEDGAPGPAGPQGEPGPTGPQGKQGEQGPAGLTGEQGPAGPQGEQGLPGSVGATGSAGPQGVPGATGATGATGPTGPVGLTGAIGPQGPAGADGLDGLDGADGQNAISAGNLVAGDAANPSVTFTLVNSTTVWLHYNVTGGGVNEVFDTWDGVAQGSCAKGTNQVSCDRVKTLAAGSHTISATNSGSVDRATLIVLGL